VIQIPLRNRSHEIVAYSLIDDEDEELVSPYTWTRNRYVVTTVPHPGGGIVVSGTTGKVRARRTHLKMHRLILGLEFGDPREADHADHNKLNNQRYNLRPLTQAQNQQNKVSYAGSASEYRGVYQSSYTNLWEAKAEFLGRVHNIGKFHTEAEAGEAAIKWRAENMPYSEEALLYPQGFPDYNITSYVPVVPASLHRGVTRDTVNLKWKARVKVRGVEVFLGRFDSEEEAARVAREYRENHGIAHRKPARYVR
jgi:hypothetical protein